MSEPGRLTAEERGAALKLAEQLIAGFEWDHTPQGATYWHEVHHALRQVADVVPREADP